MQYILISYLFVSIVQRTQLIKAEDPFCENKCVTEEVISFRSCYCDYACWTLYGDCCADARLVNPALQTSGLRTRRDVLCKHYVYNPSTYVITSCSPDWQGPHSVSTYCHQLQRESIDPVGAAPATNYNTGVTYANYYCAVCNNDTENLLLWKIKVSCPFYPNALTDEGEALKYIFYNERSKLWGYRIRDKSSDQGSFYGCNITYRMPRSLVKQVRKCDPEEVRTCLSSWKNDFVKEMCRSYTDPVFSNGTRYKNFYCAVCNRIDQSQMTCGIGYRTGVHTEIEEISPMSFSILLDVNQSDGDSVGTKTVTVNCREGEISDPFAKKCRNVVCGIPGFVKRGGSCVLETGN